MRKHGRTRAGRQRWYCAKCALSAVKTRSDHGLRADRHRFLVWLVKGKSLADFAEELGVSLRTVWKSFQPFWQKIPLPILPVSLFGQVLVLDAICLEGRNQVLLIARTPSRVVAWEFAQGENKANWLKLLGKLPIPFAVVCDGQKGLLSAVQQLWPKAKIQRCLAHITRRAHAKLTRKPTTVAGWELKQLVYQLPKVKTRKEKRKWCHQLSNWWKKYGLLINERSYTEDQRHWWYTHKNLRHTARLLRGNLTQMFTYLKYRFVPRTTNCLEGGINARAGELIHRHRGMKLAHKQIMLAYFLSQKQG